MGDLGGERRRIEGHPEGVGQKVGERQGARGEERQEVLPAGELPAVGERGEVIAGLAPGLLARARRRALCASRPGGIRPLGEERQRQDRGLAELVVRSLRLDLEAPQALDLVAEEVEPQGLLVAGREEVEDAAAHREIADLADQVDAPVAQRGQAESELLEVDLVAASEPDRREAGGLRQPPEQGARRDEQRPQAARERVGERRDLLRAHRQRGLRLLIGRQRRRREVAADPLSRDQAKALEPGEGVRLVRHDDHDRPAGPLGDEVEDPGGGRRRQTRGAPTPGGEVGSERGEERVFGDPQGEFPPRRGTHHAPESIEAPAPPADPLRSASSPTRRVVWAPESLW